MTKKKEEQKQENKKNQKIDSDDNKQIEEHLSDQPETKQKDSESIENQKNQKVELIEEKEGAGLQLEYFSKEDLIQEIEDLKLNVKSKDEEIKNLNGWKDKYMRLQAEFENTQKRWDKNRQYLKSQYTASVLKNFLPLYDSFRKALESSLEKEQLKQFFNQFMNILKYEGAEPMLTKVNDSYDYTYHEALTTVERDDVEENHILDIIQEGWKYGKDVLRYAKVVISKKPKPPEPEPEPEKVIQADKEQKEILTEDSSNSSTEKDTKSN